MTALELLIANNNIFMRIVLTYLLVALTCLPLFGQSANALKYSKKIDTVNLKTTIGFLCSDDLAGRKSDEPGAKFSAKYLVQQLKLYTVPPANNGAYTQNIQAVNKRKANKYFFLSDINYHEHYSYPNNRFSDSVISGNKVVYAGHGVHHASFNDFRGIDISDKIVMVIDKDGPKNKFGVPCHNSWKAPNFDYMDKQKPLAVLRVREGFDKFKNYSREGLGFYSEISSTPTAPVIEINELLANSILEPTNKSIKQLQYISESNCKSNSFEFNNSISFNGNTSYSKASINNIIGIVEGSELKNEYIVVSAHYDHIGTNYNHEVYPGADDNASGVSVVLELARLFNHAKQAGKGPKRSIIFLFTTAEEDGLEGATYYTKAPVYPLENTVACVNIDMLGRIGTTVSDEAVNNGYVYALTGVRGKNPELFEIPNKINSASTQLELFSLDGKNYSNFFTRSDHYAFFRKNIPSILFTNGPHKDLHKITDSEDKIMYPALLERAKLVLLTVWELSNMANTISFSKN